MLSSIEASKGLVGSDPDSFHVARSSGDRKFLTFIADRLVSKYGENENTDYIQTLRLMAKEFPAISRQAKSRAEELKDIFATFSQTARTLMRLELIKSHEDIQKDYHRESDPKIRDELAAQGVLTVAALITIQQVDIERAEMDINVG